MKKEDKKLLVTGGLAGAFASLCCIGPIILILFGVGTVSSALAVGKYTWLFTSLAILFFTIATVLYIRNKKCNTTNTLRNNWKIILGGFILLVIFLILLKYWLAPLLAQWVYR